MRLHLVCTLHGLPIGWALTGAKADEHQTYLDILANTPAMNRLQADGHHQILIEDKSYFGAEFEETIDQAGIELLRLARKGEKSRSGARFFKPLRQIIESINDTLLPPRHDPVRSRLRLPCRGITATGLLGKHHQASPQPPWRPATEHGLGRFIKTRMRMDETTQKYVECRTAEGLSYREIKRVFKRYLARDLFW